MKTHTFIFVFLTLLLISCRKDVMDKIIFIPDEKDPNLPAYTEWGYNSFGAKYGNDYFLVFVPNKKTITLNTITPCTIKHSNHQIQFLLHGVLRNGHEMRLLFTFPLIEQMTGYYDLVKLPKEEIVLSAANNCTVSIDNTPLHDLNGKLHFKRVQLLNIDGTMERAILSGTFELDFKKNGVNETISNGRFDMGISNKEFFN